MDYAPCFVAMLREESGLEQPDTAPFKRGKWSYMNHPADPGGPTMMGVTQAVYDGWRVRMGLPCRDVRELEDRELMDIYVENYWRHVDGELLPKGLDIAVFDFAVNSGPSRAVKELQALLGVPVDGHMGAVTIGAIDQVELEPLILDYMDRRKQFCRRLRNYPSFKNGWERRWQRIEQKAVAAARGHEWVPTTILSLTSGPAVDEPTGGKAAEPAATTSMTRSTTAGAAVVTTSSGLVMLGTDAFASLQKLMTARPPSDALAFAGAWSIEMMTRASAWMALFTVVLPGVYIWFERKRKALLDGATR